MFAYGEQNADKSYGPALANYDIDNLTIAADGAFEAGSQCQKASREYDGDWWPLLPGTNCLQVAVVVRLVA